MCLVTSCCASFCQGIRRYSLRIIFMRSSHSFHASLETLSKMRWPSSPGHGTVSRPGSSFWNLTHMTLRPLVFVEGRGAGAVGPQESAMKPIVVDLAGGQHREFQVHRERQPRVRVAKGALDRVRAIGAREDEPEIAGPFGQRHEPLIR